MTVFQGIVGMSWLNKSVKPNSSMTQLSLSTSTMVLSKSKTTTISDMFVLGNGENLNGPEEEIFLSITRLTLGISQCSQDLFLASVALRKRTKEGICSECGLRLNPKIPKSGIFDSKGILRCILMVPGREEGDHANFKRIVLA